LDRQDETDPLLHKVFGELLMNLLSRVPLALAACGRRRAAAAGVSAIALLAVQLGPVADSGGAATSKRVGSSCNSPYRLRLKYTSFTYAWHHRDPNFGYVYAWSTPKVNYQPDRVYIRYDNAYTPADVNPVNGDGPDWEHTAKPHLYMLLLTVVIDKRRLHFCGPLQRSPEGRLKYSARFAESQFIAVVYRRNDPKRVQVTALVARK
jgi:hypothetical protein